jgi:hypothetical protein
LLISNRIHFRLLLITINQPPENQQFFLC